MPRAQRLEPQAGHIGMVVGRSGEEKLYRPLAAWLGSLPEGKPARRRGRA
jgi:hypothetical protein